MAVVASCAFVIPAFSAEQPDDCQSFIDGFEAYKQKDFDTSQGKLRGVLEKYPDSPLRDVVLFWLARSYYKNGNQLEAARYMSTFAREYPDSPLLALVEDDLNGLVVRYEKGELLPTLAGKAAPLGG
ncbi:tol-pal system YbgF family protein [Geobacter sp. AOG1]|uniref:tetratricopeptide repeat protein n=1 Tax=Geobacter sp. AOG1 TaxID=1566346 RepID=UPI001CC72CB6|nr:tetratricopeptide repeat protein [Geobacter sp. AOG1]